MANSVTQYTLDGAANDMLVRRLIHIDSDGSEESDLIIFNNSDFISDVSKGQLLWIKAKGSNCELIFSWDQDSDFEIVRLTPSQNETFFVGGLRGSNPNAAGATGDLFLTTDELTANDNVTIEILVKQA